MRNVRPGSTAPAQAPFLPNVISELMIEPIVEFEVVSEENSSLQRQQHGTPLQVGGAELHMRQ